jgi:succinate dehydrogenase/fumarate reductase flavoprotein subunit
VHEHDVVVLGTGAAGLIAAIAAHEHGATVGLYEKAGRVGGTTGLSGGVVWVPNNPHMADAGIADSRGDALAYLAALSHGYIRSDLAAALVDAGPEMVRFIEERTALRLRIVPSYPDYHPEHPGGKPGGGRSLEPELYPLGALGEWAERIVTNGRAAPLLLAETPTGGAVEVPPAETIAARAAQGLVGLGPALVAGLLHACLERGIEPVTGARATRFVVEDGRVTGVTLDVAGEPRVARARRGVVLATGGFEWDTVMAREFLRGPMTHPAGIPTNTGDGQRMAMEIGASMGNMREAWWVPVIEVPGAELYGAPRPSLCLLERTAPRSLMVNRSARRFCNEAANYNALGGAFHQFDPVAFDYVNLPCWLVFDEEYRRRYPVAGIPPGDTPPSWFVSAPTAEALGAALGIDGATLADTIARFNEHARRGDDPDFHRGRSAYDGFNGDHRYDGPFATLGPLDQPPFHAVRSHSGALGTKGGPRTDTEGRVLDHGGRPIPGLYAAGNAMAGVTGMVYAGAGGTLGPALTFGYLAGRTAAGSP